MKKFGGTFLCILTLLCLSGCRNVFQKQGEKASDLEYGSITIVQKKDGTGSRALDVSEITSATVTVSGYGMTDIVKENVQFTNGAASVTVDNIPVGKKRVVSVVSNVTGAVIRGVSDIEPGENNCPVNWGTTAEANVFYELIKDGTDVSSIEKSSFNSKIPEVHASLFDAEAFASAFKVAGFSDAGITSDDYVLDYGNIVVNYTNTNGYTVQVTDIASEKTSFTKSSGTTALKGYPGEYKVKVFDETGTLKETKDVVVASGKDTTINLEYGTGVDFSNRTIIFVKAGSAPDIWAWEEDGAALSENYTSPKSNWGTSSVGTKMVAATSDYMANPSGWYMIDYTYKADGTTKLATGKTIKFKLNWSDPELTGAAGTFWYDSTSTTSNPSPVVAGLSVSVINPAVPMKPTVKVNYADGEEIDVNGSVTFTVESENTPLTRGTYTVGSRTGTLAVGTNKIDLPSGLSAGQTITVSANVENAKGSDSLSISLTTAEIAQPSIPTRLGAFYERCATSFSIWSPDSSNVKVAVKKQGETSFSEYSCTKGFAVDGGYPDSSNIYGVTVMGDCNLAEYQFYVGGKAVRDPYGKMVKYEDADAKTNVIDSNKTVDNCSITTYRGSMINIVMDVDSIKPSKGVWAARPSLPCKAASVVYEIHVGDFTISSTWNGTESYRGKFKGVTEEKTTYTSGSKTVKTGLDHLVELGVTHVQIMPMYDYATKVNNTVGDFYNWGYDPVNYNVPEDRYAENPRDYVERIREVKDMVNILHQKGIRVIMDVVYNHTFDKEMFKYISEKYYTAKDLSGCGNSVDVSNSMVSRLVRDSLEYWLETYNLDGFRFDLMGIYTKDAVGDWGQYLNTKYSDRELLLYGEPYAADNYSTSAYVNVYANLLPDLEYAGFGGFAHKYREALKGNSDGDSKGYMFNNNPYDKEKSAVEWVQLGLRGSPGNSSSDKWTYEFTKQPYQAVNYLAAHDNLCLYDKIVKAGVTGNTSESSAYQQALVKFGHGIAVLSQGVGFLHGGDDFLRTKAGYTWSEFVFDTEHNRIAKENSYMFGSEMNQIDWSRKATYYDVFKYHKDLIAFKKAHDGFYQGNAITSSDGMTIYYKVTDSNGTKLTCVLNPGNSFEYGGSGTMVMNKTGAVNSTSNKTCEGTGVTIFKN